MPDDTIAAIRQLLVLHGGKEALDLGFDRLRQQPAGAGAENFSQGIVDFAGLTKADNGDRLIHGVSLSIGGLGKASPPPIRRLSHAVITHAVITHFPQ